eukprot:scaffold186026_cov28-Tisochrysis_lutea.AAC.1
MLVVLLNTLAPFASDCTLRAFAFSSSAPPSSSSLSSSSEESSSLESSESSPRSRLTVPYAPPLPLERRVCLRPHARATLRARTKATTTEANANESRFACTSWATSWARSPTG